MSTILELITEIRKQAEELERLVNEPFGGVLSTDPRSDEEIAQYETEQERNVDHARDY